MDKEYRQRIQELWKVMIDNITDIDGIVDGLFSAGILTNPLKERIMGKKGSDRIRELLDILPRRGNKAFDAFYDVLVQCEEYEVAQKLCPEKDCQTSRQGLKGIGDPSDRLEEKMPSVRLEVKMPAVWPDSSLEFDKLHLKKVTNQSVIEEFQTASQAQEHSAYQMTNIPHGVCLIINNEDFSVSREKQKGDEVDATAVPQDNVTPKAVRLNNRQGTEVDMEALSRLFTQLQFRVHVENNLKAEEMLSAITKAVSMMSGKQVDCFVCAVLTHGNKDELYGVDGLPVSIEEFKSRSHVDSLHHKPKIFIFQACQGKKKDQTDVSDGLGEGDSDSEENADSDGEEHTDTGESVFLKMENLNLRSSSLKTKKKPAHGTDVFTAYATLPEYVSWRNTCSGSWFIQALVFVIFEFCHEFEICKLFKLVNKLVQRAETRPKKNTTATYRQVCKYETTMVNDFYFFPGLAQPATSD